VEDAAPRGQEADAREGLQNGEGIMVGCVPELTRNRKASNETWLGPKRKLLKKSQGDGGKIAFVTKVRRKGQNSHQNPVRGKFHKDTGKKGVFGQGRSVFVLSEGIQNMRIFSGGVSNVNGNRTAGSGFGCHQKRRRKTSKKRNQVAGGKGRNDMVRSSINLMRD